MEDSLLTVTWAIDCIHKVQTHRALLTVHTPSWKHCYLNTSMHTVMWYLWYTEANYFPQVKIYGCPMDCVNQIIPKSVILVWEWFAVCLSLNSLNFFCTCLQFHDFLLHMFYFVWGGFFQQIYNHWPLYWVHLFNCSISQSHGTNLTHLGM